MKRHLIREKKRLEQLLSYYLYQAYRNVDRDEEEYYSHVCAVNLVKRQIKALDEQLEAME